jgi:hypothetical protein
MSDQWPAFHEYRTVETGSRQLRSVAPIGTDESSALTDPTKPAGDVLLGGGKRQQQVSIGILDGRFAGLELGRFGGSAAGQSFHELSRPLREGIHRRKVTVSCLLYLAVQERLQFVQQMSGGVRVFLIA